MKHVAIRNIERSPMNTLSTCSPFGVATIHEAQGRVGLLKPYIQSIYPKARACGNAVTVLAQPGDNWMLHVAIELCQPGDILVVACTTDNTDGMFGDLLATSAKSKGVRALVIDAGVRDIDELQDLEFPVWSRAISAKGTVKNTLGAVNVPVICAGQFIHPGDLIVADSDGVVVVERANVDHVLVAAQQREDNEEQKREQLASGILGLDIYNMRDRLESEGLVYLDSSKDLANLS